MVPRLLCALSKHTIIKELHLRVLVDHIEAWNFAFLWLESMLTLLSGSTGTSPNFFPSLHLLKVTVNDKGTDYDGSSYINSLLLRIKAVRTSHLKTMIVNEKNIWRDALETLDW